LSKSLNDATTGVLNCKNNVIKEKSQGESFRRPRKNPKEKLYGCNIVTKHFVQEKSESKPVELGMKSNDVGPTANPKQP
jgi:hypothetical protein